MGVRPQYHRGTPALAGHPDPIIPISAGTTGKPSTREFPGAREPGRLEGGLVTVADPGFEVTGGPLF